MHDLLRSLAQFLADGENLFSDKWKPLTDSSPKLRRLSIVESGVMIDPGVLKRRKCIRTLFLRNNQHAGVVLKQDVIETLGHLRVLDLSDTNIQELPPSIRTLGHLKYLNVSGTAIRGLPDSIADLRSLQFLLLNNCKNIHALPNGITKLKNLRCLEMYDGTQVDQMPKGTRQLNQLRMLKDFVVGKDGSLAELGPLVNLHMLVISKLERVSDKVQARSAALENKTSMIYISLECTFPMMTTSSSAEEMKSRMVDVFDELRPPPSLQVLHIFGSVGLTLPSWMWPSAAPSVSPIHDLEILFLNYCINIPQLPPLGLLPHLKQLWIKGSLSLKSIIPKHPCPTPMLPTYSSSFSSFSGDATATCTALVLFPKLERMILQDMPSLESLDGEREDNGESMVTFPCLQFLGLSNCPKLRRLPGLPWRCPKTLMIMDCPALTEVRHLSAPETLILHDGSLDALPPWLAQVSVNPMDNVASLHLKVKCDLLKRLLRQKEEDKNSSEGDWHIVKHFPQVYVQATDDESAFFHCKDPLFFNNNKQSTRNGSNEERESKRLRAE